MSGLFSDEDDKLPPPEPAGPGLFGEAEPAPAPAPALATPAYRVLARLDLTSALNPGVLDAVTGGMPQLYNNTVPFLIFIPSTTTASNISGNLIYAQG